MWLTRACFPPVEKPCFAPSLLEFGSVYSGSDEILSTPSETPPSCQCDHGGLSAPWRGCSSWFREASLPWYGEEAKCPTKGTKPV